VTWDWTVPGLRDLAAGSLAAWALAGALVVSLLTAAACRASRARWFHPLALPLAVIAVMSLGAPAWVLVTHRPAGLLFDPGYEPAGASSLAVAVSGTACAALVLVVAGYAAGTVISLLLVRDRQPGAARALHCDGLRRAGLALMAAAVASRALAAWMQRGSAYGAGQLTYSLPSLLSAAGATVFLAGLIAVTVAACRDAHPLDVRAVLRGREWAALACYLAVVAASGERGGLIAPLVIVAWSYSTRVRPIRARWLAAGLVAALALAAVISNYRAGVELSPGSPASVLQAAAGDVNSPAWLTQQTVTAVPWTEPWQHGSTYVAAAEAQVPGPLSRHLGATTRTASAVFRHMIGFWSPDQGYAESYPSEAYLNWGLPGCLGAGLFLGLLLGWAWRRHRDPASRVTDLLYPLLLAGLAYGFRSDALTQVKDVLYPALILLALLRWNRPGQPVTARTVATTVPADIG
jgi:hypothetical protein